MPRWLGAVPAVHHRYPRNLWLVGLVGLLVVGGLVGFRSLSRPAPPAGAVEVSAEQALVEGDQRLARRDYRGALEAYDRGLERFPRDLRLLYRAGVALSFLGDREQAALVFRSVVRHGDPASAEFRAAQTWLLGAARRPGG